MDEGVAKMDEGVALTTEHEIERASHALYGLIIVTATLVAEKDHVDDAADAIGLLVGTGLVLLLAHTYTAVVAARAVEGHSLGIAGRRLVVLDNIPVALAIVGPIVLFIVAWLDGISLRTAYVVSITLSVVLLFLLGLYQGRTAGETWTRSIITGAAAAAIGLVVIGFEAWFD